jgi:hypothetical protein
MQPNKRNKKKVLPSALWLSEKQLQTDLGNNQFSVCPKRWFIILTIKQLELMYINRIYSAGLNGQILVWDSASKAKVQTILLDFGGEDDYNKDHTLRQICCRNNVLLCCMLTFCCFYKIIFEVFS